MVSSEPISTSPSGRLRRLLGVSLVVLAASALWACGSSSTPTLNTGVIQRAIAGSILAQHHLQTTVVCPSHISRKAGVRFVCSADLNVGSYPVAVTVTNNQGHVVYQNGQSLVAVDIAKVEQAISSSLHQQKGIAATVTCPAEVLQQEGLTFTCSAALPGGKRVFTVTQVDGSGHVRYVEAG